MSVAEKRGKCFPLPHIFRYFAASYYEKAKNVNLIIDIGNSAAKLAVFHQGEMIDMEYDTNHELGKLENICERYDIRQGILSSVIHLNDIIDSQLKRLDFPLLRLDYKTPLPVTNLYRTPKTLGSDRIAAVVGAYTRFPGRDILVVDAGTALTEGLENVAVTAIDELVEFARQNDVALTVVGPEAPLAAGVVDAFRSAGRRQEQYAGTTRGRFPREGPRQRA